MAYPTALDTGSSLPNPSTSNNTNNPSHAGLHGLENAAIIATETKLGTGASTPASNTLLIGTGAGTSAWSALTSSQLAGILSDETGTGSAVFANTPTLITPKVDTINEATLNNGVTVGGVNLKSGFMSGANLTAGTVGNSQLATGVAVQQVSSVTTAVATGTTIIPQDDTIPQITEGDQYMSLAITPKAITNTLVITVCLYGALSVGIQDMAVALFQDSTANALSTVAVTSAGNNYRLNPNLTYIMTAGTTSATTFKVRAGGSTASTMTFNGDSGARRYGTTAKSSITITEYKV